MTYVGVATELSRNRNSKEIEKTKIEIENFQSSELNKMYGKTNQNELTTIGEKQLQILWSSMSAYLFVEPNWQLGLK